MANTIEVDGETYDAERLSEVIRFVKKFQFASLADILVDRGLITTEQLAPYEMKEELYRGCRLVTLDSPSLMSIIVGLELSWLLRYEIRDTGEFRQCLKGWMQKLGDQIMAIWEEGYAPRKAMTEGPNARRS